MNLKREMSKIATKIDKLGDSFDKENLRLSNRNLVLLRKEDDSVEIAVIANSKTKRWIKNNLNIDVNGEQYNKVAYTIYGETIKLEQRATTEIDKVAYSSYFQNREVTALFDYSNNSNRLFWTIEKLNALDSFKADDKLNIVNLIALQDKLNEEIKNKKLAKEKKEDKEEDNELEM